MQLIKNEREREIERERERMYFSKLQEYHINI